MTETQTKELEGALSPDLARWRKCRDFVATALMGITRLSPSQVVRLRYSDLYHNHRPVKWLEVPDRIAKGGRPYTVYLPGVLRYALSVLHSEPMLIEDYPLTRPLLSKKPYGSKPLTASRLRDIRGKTGFFAQANTYFSNGGYDCNGCLNAQ